MKTIRSPNLAPGETGLKVMVTLSRGYARGGLVKAARAVRGAGRFGDTLLVHINEREYDQLKRAWGQPHFNPQTHLPEFFDVSGLLGDMGMGSWGDAVKTVAPYVLSGLTSKANVDQANRNLAPLPDANLQRPLGNYTNSRQYTPPKVDPKSYYTYGQTTGEPTFYKNNSLGAVTGAIPAPLKGPQQYSPSVLGSIGQSIGQGVVKNLLSKYLGSGAAPARTVEMNGLPNGAFAAQPGDEAMVSELSDATSGGAGASGAGAGAGAGGAGAGAADASAGWAAPSAESLGAPGSQFTMAGSVPGSGGAGAAGSGAGSGLGATLGGVGGALALGVLGKHMQDNTAGMSYQQSRDLVNWFKNPNADFTDPTHGRGPNASTPLSAPPPGFPSWTKYFMAQQIIGKMNTATGGAKDQGSYKMLLGELGLPTDQSFYAKAWPGAGLAYDTIMGTNRASSGFSGRARGGLVQHFDVGGLAMSGAGNAFQPQIGQLALGQGHPTPPPPMTNYGAGQMPGSVMPNRPVSPFGGPPPMSGPGGPGPGAPGAPGAFGPPQHPPLPPTGMGVNPAWSMTGSPQQNAMPPAGIAPPQRIPGPASMPAQPIRQPIRQPMGGLGQMGGRMGMSMGRPQFAVGGAISGPGTGISDDIPARLSDGEYVIPAHIVAALGDGSTAAGAKRLDQLQRQVRMMAGRQMAVGRHPKPSPLPIQFLTGRK